MNTAYFREQMMFDLVIQSTTKPCYVPVLHCEIAGRLHLMNSPVLFKVLLICKGKFRSMLNTMRQVKRNTQHKSCNGANNSIPYQKRSYGKIAPPDRKKNGIE